MYAIRSYYASQITITYDTDYTFRSMDNYEPEQIDRELSFTRGKPDRNFEKAHVVIEETYSTSAQKHYDLEPLGAAAFIQKDGIEITCATQWPFNVKDNVSAALGIPGNKVNVNVPTMGKTHSGKLWYAGLLACYAAVVSWKTSEPSICIV